MSENSRAVKFLYGTIAGRIILKIIMVLHLDRIVVHYLWSPLSRPLARWYVNKYNINEMERFSTYREMFVRTRITQSIDSERRHLISPCDGWVSYFEIDENSCFTIKNSSYKLKDFVQDIDVAARYHNGICLIFRLCASDYHHYCYVDDGIQGKNHYIPGVLHSVQPIACETYPVYVLNKRCWSILDSENFGPILQCEIGALVVGDIINEHENKMVSKGERKGYFELAGSTIVLLFEQESVKMRTSLCEEFAASLEVRVKQGEWIGSSVK